MCRSSIVVAPWLEAEAGMEEEGKGKVASRMVAVQITSVSLRLGPSNGIG